MRLPWLLLPLAVLLACDRPIGPSQAGDPAFAPAAAPAEPVALAVNGLTLTRAELEQRVPTTADAQFRRAALDATVDLLLAASEARRLEPYRDLPPLEAGERFLVDQFADERFCDALPDVELERFYRSHRTRYVHPDHHVLAALRAQPAAGAGTDDLAAALDEGLASELADDERAGADAFDALVTRWEGVCRRLGALPAAELWTFFSVADHPERTPPARHHPEDTPALVALIEGARTPAWGADDGVRLYVKLEGHPAARRELREPEVRADVRRRACDEHRQEARRRFLDELRGPATIVLTPRETTSGAR